MEIAIKLGDARLPDNPVYEKNWFDGQPIEARWDGFPWQRKDRSSFLIIRTIDDFWQVRGGTDWKVWNHQAEEFKRLFSAKDSQGKFRWEFGYLFEEKRIRMRDRFLDITALLKDETIARNYYDNLYNHDVEAGILNLNLSLFDILKYEGIDQREVMIKNQGITSGTYQIGTGGGADYATWTLFATDVNAGGQMTGNLTGEGQNEETAIATDVLFDTDTNGFLLKLTAESGAEHDGTLPVGDGDGAWINYTAGDSIAFDETTGDDLANVEVSKLALDASGTNNLGVYAEDVGGIITINRLLIKGGWDSQRCIQLGNASYSATVINNICYGMGDAGGETGITIETPAGSGPTVIIANNTLIGNYQNLVQERAGEIAYTLIIKNNLCQAAQNVDYRDDGGGFGTTAKNVSEDATSPDAAYQSKDVYTNSVFKDYGNDDYRLDPEGDSTNLAILDDGEDLSGTFTDDVEGQTRSTWYIGASEIVGAPPAGIEIFRRRIAGY